MAQAKYNQIFQTLRGRIDSGAYGFLELLPSENALAEEFGCTRNTVRKALADELLFGRLQHGGRVTVDLDDAGKVALEYHESFEPPPPEPEDEAEVETVES